MEDYLQETEGRVIVMKSNLEVIKNYRKPNDINYDPKTKKIQFITAYEGKNIKASTTSVPKNKHYYAGRMVNGNMYLFPVNIHQLKHTYELEDDPNEVPRENELMPLNIFDPDTPECRQARDNLCIDDEIEEDSKLDDVLETLKLNSVSNIPLSDQILKTMLQGIIH